MYTKDDVAQPSGSAAKRLSDDERQAIADEWNQNEQVSFGRVRDERERRLDTSITVTLSDGDYVIPVTDRSLALVPTAARRARKTATTRPFPTDKGIIERSADDLDLIEDALDRYTTAVWRRAGELERMVADKRITASDLETGWPEKS